MSPNRLSFCPSPSLSPFLPHPSHISFLYIPLSLPPSLPPSSLSFSLSLSLPPMPLLGSAAVAKTGRCVAITLIGCDFFIYMTSARRSWEPTACSLHPVAALVSLGPWSCEFEEGWRETKGVWNWMVLRSLEVPHPWEWVALEGSLQVNWRRNFVERWGEEFSVRRFWKLLVLVSILSKTEMLSEIKPESEPGVQTSLIEEILHRERQLSGVSGVVGVLDGRCRTILSASRHSSCSSSRRRCHP